MTAAARAGSRRARPTEAGCARVESSAGDAMDAETCARSARDVIALHCLSQRARRVSPARSRRRARRHARAAASARSLKTTPARCGAGHVAHQFTTAVRSPASAATSQNVFARRSLPLAIAGRVRRTRSVAPRIARPRGDGSAIGDAALDAGDPPRFEPLHAVHFGRLASRDRRPDPGGISRRPPGRDSQCVPRRRRAPREVPARARSRPAFEDCGCRSRRWR